MRKRLAIGAGLLLLNLATVGLAGAQTIYTGPGVSEAVLPPYEIMSIVRTTGLTPLTRPMRRGPYYVLVAVDRVGRQMRVVVDAQLGDIVNLRPALAAASYGPEITRPIGPPGAIPPLAGPPADAVGAAAVYGARPNVDTVPPPSPPRPISHPSADLPQRTIPNGHAAGAASPALPPTRLAVAEPAGPPPPPLPRPRPKLAANEAAAAPPALPAVKPATPPGSGYIE